MKNVTLKYLLIGILLGMILINFSISAVTGLKDEIIKGTLFDLEDYTAQASETK